MKNQIIIHAAGKQTRIALLENGELAQLFIESPENQRTVGDIYLAEVRKVMGGIRAAFIDMNTPKDAFLHFSDLGEHLDDYLVMLNGQNVLQKESVNRLQELRNKKDPNLTSKNGTNTEEQNILGNMLKAGQKVLVQIVKEPIGSKGPRVSTNISIAGRFLVLIPMGDYVAVSKRIKSYKERRVLRQTVSDILPEGFGVIVRTVAEGQDPQMIHDDLKDVLEKWNNIVKNLSTAKPPTLLHRDLEMTESLVRDLFAKDFDRILVDDSKMYKTLKQYVSKIAPSMLPNLVLYNGSEHVFDHMKIMQDVESVFSPRVKMPSGGYLIFEQTEAMYVVDVNSGRYAAKKAQEDNSLKTNLESAREIAKQLRLRDIGGIIVVDFIDLREEVNRKKVYDELKKEFRKDRAKTNLLPMSDFGLVQITRQRIRPSVVKSVSRVCPMCGGGGSIVTQNTILSDIEGWLQKFKRSTNYRSVDLHINPYMKGMLTKGWMSQHYKWMLKYRIRIGIIEDSTLSMNDYKFTLSGSDVDITETIMMDQSIEQAIKAAEQRIAELESELKRDSTTLDIYPKERPANQRDQRRPDSGQSDSRNNDGDRRHDSRPPVRETRPTPPPVKPTPQKPAERVENITNEQPTKSTPVKSAVPKDGGKKSPNISKYYKKSDELQTENDEMTENVKQLPRDSEVLKSKISPIVSTKETAKGDDKTSDNTPSNEIPEELSHLKSAWDVAREYKLKRETELSGIVLSDQKKSNTPENKGVIESAKEQEISSTNAVDASSTETTKKKTTKKVDSKESVVAASQIVQAIMKAKTTEADNKDSKKTTKPASKAAKSEPAKKAKTQEKSTKTPKKETKKSSPKPKSKTKNTDTDVSSTGNDTLAGSGDSNE
jgi:ribonuclease G